VTTDIQSMLLPSRVLRNFESRVNYHVGKGLFLRTLLTYTKVAIV